MNNMEKGLAEKVMFAIYIDSQKEVEDYFREYIAYTNLLGKKKDMNLLEKTCRNYIDYQVKKSKERLKEDGEKESL